jgi:RimJ/RimL family protein N-acetyltransferase
MALLVEVDNAAAKRLYKRLGFRAAYTKRIAGQEYWYGAYSAPRRTAKNLNPSIRSVLLGLRDQIKPT